MYVLFGIICIERSEIIQVLLNDPVALARPLLQALPIQNHDLGSLVRDEVLIL